MENKFNFSQNQMDALLQMAGRKMGSSPDQLRQQMQTGQVDALLSGLPEEKQAQVQQLLHNPEAIEKFIQNPQVQQLIRGLMGGR